MQTPPIHAITAPFDVDPRRVRQLIGIAIPFNSLTNRNLFPDIASRLSVYSKRMLHSQHWLKLFFRRILVVKKIRFNEENHDFENGNIFLYFNFP
ncbi:hypothetical protein AQ611_06040 [Burkholderia singularis]|nr:hypothetical protein AQ611_06040 [Burkholderia sp. Bp7605]